MKKENNDTFAQDYKKIIDSSMNHTVVIKTEWTKLGDSFTKLSLYDNSYSPVTTLGNTTLFKP